MLDLPAGDGAWAGAVLMYSIITCRARSAGWRIASWPG